MHDDVDAFLAQRRGHLAPDESHADDGRLPARRNLGCEGHRRRRPTGESKTFCRSSPGIGGRRLRTPVAIRSLS